MHENAAKMETAKTADKREKIREKKSQSWTEQVMKKQKRKTNINRQHSLTRPVDSGSILGSFAAS